MKTINTTEKADRSRNWFLLLYPDNPDHVKAFEKIPEMDYEFVGCLHDKDLLDDGSKAKPHWHILLKFKDAVWNTAISKDIGLEVRFIVKSDNWKRSARYLVHKDHPKKYQYEKEALFGPMTEKAIDAINKSDPEEEAAKVAQIIKTITEWPGVIDDADFVLVICEKKLYAEYRRALSAFNRMIDKHNRVLLNENTRRRYDQMDRDGFSRFCANKEQNDALWVERCQLGYQEVLPMEEE